MEIKNIRLEEDGESVTLAADCKIRYYGYDRVYFKFEKKYKDFLVADASPFAAALLVPAMSMGRNLTIDGIISEKLYEGMHRAMKIMLSWDVGLRPVSILPKELKKDEYQPTGTASFFSGGVDSFFTYLRNKEEGDEKIKYFILADGFDIELENRELWEMTCKTVDDVAQSEGIEVIKVESNIRELIEKVELWDYTHGGCLAALGLSLRKELKTVFVPSSLTYEQLLPWGSHPYVDPLWGTETISFRHDGADTPRVDKVRFISRYAIALKNLRVCFINKKNKFNCGTCEKCLRTMTSLLIAGALEKAETFPHKIDIEAMKKLKLRGKTSSMLHYENLVEMKKMRLDEGLQKIIEKNVVDYYIRKFDFKETLKLPKFYLLETLNEIRLLDFFYDQDRLYSKKILLQKIITQKTKEVKKKMAAKGR